MPIPNPKKNEKQNDYMGRCMDFLSKEDRTKRPQKQKVAICLNTYRNPKNKSKANEIEIDFSEDIKNMNKTEEIKIEETPKVEATIQAPTNNAVTAPAPEIQSEAVKIEVPKTETPKLPEEPKKVETPKFEAQQKTTPSEKTVWMEKGSVEEVKAEVDGKGELIQTTMLQMQNQYKIFHWQTASYSQHNSFGGIYDSLSENIDEFIETYMGKYGRVISAGTFNLSLANYASSDFVAITDGYISFLIGLSSQLDSAKDSDLLNIRDEILGSLNKLKYLLTLG